jgi:hypothetical protein
MKTLSQRIETVQQLWVLAIGDIPEPSMDKLIYWTGTYSENELDHAFIRASSKLHKGGIVRSPDEVQKYISGVLYQESCQIKAKLARTLAKMKERQQAGVQR